MAEYTIKSGKVAKLFDFEEGTLIEGDGSTPLTVNAWYKIESKASSGSVLPFDEGYVFKTGTALTPIVGDNVYPITITPICKVDTSVNTSKGTIDVTDDCSDSYNQMITDGFTDISGDASGFFKLDKATGAMPAIQEKYLNKFMAIQSDDGAGGYTLSEIDNSDIYIGILQNSDETAEGHTQQWLLVPAILSGLTLGKSLKSGQSFDLTWSKGINPAGVYKRTTNATETVF